MEATCPNAMANRQGTFPLTECVSHYQLQQTGKSVCDFKDLDGEHLLFLILEITHGHML